MFVNMIAAWMLPAIGGTILILLGFLGILIPLMHLAPISPAEFVFATWSSYSGYPGGLGWFVGLTTSSVLFIVFDGACHMGKSAGSLQIPFCIGHVDNALSTPTGYPAVGLCSLPFSNTAATADLHWSIPLYDVALLALITPLLALINIGTSVAFNALVS
ncbi:hypothetical protein K504DRAFT_498444 [Pleomassaria siparia CBS 279.74]|uniref:Uncharacterized protein n=1 Tax=Pleomassaria siparia CBS 279.74 TaxID=1314801 RepID=A0A6G1KLC4_9PLEO|nr:hypothetical protein K504DRAFT_498444 [Pleomassaria siparia CBS 279.74]